MIEIRPAMLNDLKGIMKVEEMTFGSFSREAMASAGVMAERIELCNSNAIKWFWLAQLKDEIFGYIILQPTKLAPEQCVSWEKATDYGTLKNTFDNNGDNVYIVSLASCQNAPIGVSELLVHAGTSSWAMSGKKNIIFCSRMPGFALMNRKTGISAEDYWQLKYKDGKPKDSMIRMYWEMAGKVNPSFLLKNGFPPDKESGGHGVLFVINDSAKALRATASLIYRAGMRNNKKNKI